MFEKFNLEKFLKRIRNWQFLIEIKVLGGKKYYSKLAICLFVLSIYLYFINYIQKKQNNVDTFSLDKITEVFIIKYNYAFIKDENHIIRYFIVHKKIAIYLGLFIRFIKEVCWGIYMFNSNYIGKSIIDFMKVVQEIIIDLSRIIKMIANIYMLAI